MSNNSANFYELLGRCIATWAWVDDALFLMFSECLGAFREQAAIVYYRSPGLDIRLNLTEELLLSVLPQKQRRSGGHDDPSVKEWRSIAKQFRDLLPIRRRLAHHPVNAKAIPYFQFGVTPFGSAPFYGGGPLTELSVEVGEYEKLRLKGTDLPPLGVSNLDAHVADVRTLANAISEFSRTALAQAVEARQRNRGER